MGGAESVPFTPSQQHGRAALTLAEQSLTAYIERERGEMLANGNGQTAALAELEKIQAAMLEELFKPRRGSP